MMGLRAVQSLQLGRVLGLVLQTTSRASSCKVPLAAPRCPRNRLITKTFISSNQRHLYSSESENVGQHNNNTTNDDNQVSSRTSLESTEFKEKISNFAKSFEISQSADTIIPAFIHKSYLVRHASGLKNQHQDNEQLALLGFQTSKRFLTELLTVQFPHFSAQQLWDIQNGLLEREFHLIAKVFELESVIASETSINKKILSQTLMAVVGVIYINEGPEKARQLLQEKFISNLNEDRIKEILKLQHPKYILRSLMKKSEGESLRTRILRKNTPKSDARQNKAELYKVGVFRCKTCLAIGISESAEHAEKKACQNALLDHFPDQLRSFELLYEADDFDTEEKIDFGLITSRQRIVTLEKEDEGFGFSIKGGEKKKLKNEQWLVYNYFSPIFITSIVPEGLAHRHGGLRVGDVILAVNDRSLVGIDHAGAVKILKSVSGTVDLTVRYSKQVLLTDRVETDFKKMKRRKRMAELTSEVWAEWHQAQANQHPEKYADVLRL